MRRQGMARPARRNGGRPSSRSCCKPFRAGRSSRARMARRLLHLFRLGVVAWLILLAVPPPVAAQHDRRPRIGVLSNGAPRSAQVEAFRQGLRDTGWIEGQTVMVEYRFANGNSDRLPALAAELVRLKVDIIVLSGSSAVRAARDATTTIPIVFAMLGDPVTAGFVPSLARPGGNMTGLASEFEQLVTKQLQLLKELAPKAARVGMLHHAETGGTILKSVASAAQALGLTIRALKVVRAADFDHALKTARSEGVEAIHVLPSPFFGAHRRQLVELVARHRQPAIYEFREYVDDGGLMSYGPSISDMHRGMATYVDQILKGARPG